MWGYTPSEDLGGPNIFRFSLSHRFSSQWLISPDANRLFAIASVISIATTPLAFGLVRFESPSPPVSVIAGIMGVVGAAACLFLWFGMWAFWKRVDRGSSRSRQWWAVILVMALWVGCAAYYFLVYRSQTKKEQVQSAPDSSSSNRY